MLVTTKYMAAGARGSRIRVEVFESDGGRPKVSFVPYPHEAHDAHEHAAGIVCEGKTVRYVGTTQHKLQVWEVN